MSNVYLVGGGPGDIQLLTLQGLSCIQKADCILYDNLIDPLLLTYAKASCECIYVGKKGHHAYMPQADISRLLIEKARQYACVVRLKGGDSYVFARGGEEVIALREAAIDVQVVPGISSALAGLSAAGIPITHRGFATGFQVISAHAQGDHASFSVQDIVNPKITIVFLMGISKLDFIIEKLQEAKRDPNTPMAIIAQACTPHQQVLFATIATMKQTYAEHPLLAPALIVVGDVVSLHEQLACDRKLPLHGKQLLVCKLQHACSSLTIALKAHGASVEECQVGSIVPLSFVCSLADIKASTWMLFTSQQGVEYFFTYYVEHFDIRELAHMRFVLIGKKSAKALAKYGIHADEIIQPSHKDTLRKFLQENLHSHDQLLYPKNYDTTLSLYSEVYKIKELYVYENKEVNIPEVDAQCYDAICCSSASSVHRFMSKIKHPMNTMFVSIGASTSAALASYQVPYVEAKEPSYEAMLRVVEEALQHVSR